jgi:hypothetical protein
MRLMFHVFLGLVFDFYPQGFLRCDIYDKVVDTFLIHVETCHLIQNAKFQDQTLFPWQQRGQIEVEMVFRI